MSFKKVKGLKFFGVIFLVTLAFVLVLRTFFVQSYTVSSSQMETALLKGDRLLVDKTAYGIRLPMTIMSIPFTFDSFLGMKSYSRLIELDYGRIGEGRVSKNDIVLFNNPVEIDKPLDKRTLLLSRCMAVAGDTIVMDGNNLKINRESHVSSPDVLRTYSYNTECEDSIIPVMESFSIPVRTADSSDSTRKSILLNNYEYFILNEKLPSYFFPESNERNTASYYFIVPAKGMEVELSDFNRSLYKDIITQENLDDSQLDVNNSMEKYTFRDDYYWFISDNPSEAVDSRQIGFVSERCIIGKVSYIWLSTSGGSINPDRSFSTVK